MSSFSSIHTAVPAFFAAGGHDEGVPFEARGIFGNDFLPFLTNSVFVAAVVTGLILWFVRGAMKNISTVPGKKQNLVEMMIEFLYGQVSNIVGPRIAPKAFPLIATIFIFVTIANWFGLMPGVGTIGFSGEKGFTPFLRPATADMNLTLGIALAAFVVWIFITIREMGVWGTILHIFGPKGGMKGALKWGLMPIFLIVGVIEVVSILFRPVTLSLRLYGNVFAGENLLHAMGGLGAKYISNPFGQFLLSVLIPLPFYFLEILVGVLQGMVFAILCTVFIKLSTTHEEGHDDHGDDHGHGQDEGHKKHV